MKIYLATSWKNERQPEILKLLRSAGHEVYDFRNPYNRASGTSCVLEKGFSWSDLDPAWETWTPKGYRDAVLNGPIAAAGYLSDFRAMEWADACVIVLPCGRSAHLEAGYMKGRGKRLVFLLGEKAEPELMALMGDDLCVNVQELLAALD